MTRFNASLYPPETQKDIRRSLIVDSTGEPITSANPLPININDGNGNPLSSHYHTATDSYILDIHNADVHNSVVNEFFSRETGVSTTLAIAASVGDRVINVVDASSFAVDNVISIENGFVEAVFPIITAISVNEITINKPLDHDYSIGDTVNQLQTNLNVNGSVTPVSFFMKTERQETWHIVRFLLGMVHSSAADDIKFGSLAKLTNGCVLRGYNDASDVFKTFTFWRQNGDIKLDMFDLEYTDKAGGGLFGTNGRGSIKIGTGAVPRLTPLDYLELIIQDDLTSLTSFMLKAQGHVENL